MPDDSFIMNLIQEERKRKKNDDENDENENAEKRPRMFDVQYMKYLLEDLRECFPDITETDVLRFKALKAHSEIINSRDESFEMSEKCNQLIQLIQTAMIEKSKRN